MRKRIFNSDKMIPDMKAKDEKVSYPILNEAGSVQVESTGAPVKYEGISVDSIFPVLCPNKNSFMDVTTVITVSRAAQLMKKNLLFLTDEKFGVLNSRTSLYQVLKENLKIITGQDVNECRALMLDSDMMIKSSAEELAAWFTEADKNKWNLIGNYRTIINRDLEKGITVTNMILRPNKNLYEEEYGRKYYYYENYTDKEIAELKFGDSLGDSVAGLGFYYGDCPLDYKFYFDLYGEDFNFFRDMQVKGKEFRFIPVKNRHTKSVIL